ncbi:MAG: hypothetical protein NWQ46_11080 [Spirosomaceae bacterium]|nr:hypothetical protein [Spirosomataceae bacterium]MDP5140194.1 hypothetical protein [Spirosomataceae bacterium]
MTQISTLNQNDVIRYLYNETTPQENDRIVEALLFDVELLEFYLESVETKEGLDQVIMTPPRKVINNILAYSKKYAIEA